MPTCAQCKSRFPNYVKIDGKTKNLCSRKFCLKCSPFGSHNTRPILPGPGKPKCSSCGCRLATRGRRDGARVQHSHTTCFTCYVKARHASRKAKAVEYKGGKCLVCGYAKTEKALCFHHMDPKLKDFSVSSRRSLAWATVEKEIKKCVLLCMNCHGEVHAGIVTAEELKRRESGRLAQLVEQLGTTPGEVTGSSPVAV